MSRLPWRLASMTAVLLVGTCAVVASLADAAPGPVRAKGSGGSSAALRTGLRLAAPRSAAGAGAAGTGSDRSGLLLMSQAAAASERVPYRGEQIVVWWGQDGTSASFVQVWHRPGSAALTETATSAGGPAGTAQPAQAPVPDQGGILDVSAQMLALMEANYQIGYSGRGTADSRSADIIELRRPDGSLAATFWLDVATKLPLRRELYDTGARVIGEDAFIDLEIGQRGLGPTPATEIQPWSRQLDLARLTALRAAGWPLPGTLAGNLSLYRASETSARGAPVIDLCYSDGLSVVSLFLQRGQLPQSMTGWQRVEIAGHSVYSNGPDERSLAWSAGGYVFTVIADAAPATVGQVVAELPHSSQPGFWGRMARGFRRLASWANPFR